MASTPTGTDKNTEQMTSANQLWTIYGKPLNIPFATWISGEIMKAKASGIYKEGMNIADIVNGNRQITAGSKDDMSSSTGSTTTDGASSSDGSFKVFGLNGYVVAVVAIIGIGALIYWGSGKLVPKSA